MTPEQLANAVKTEAKRLGFELCGVAPAVSPPGAERLDEWLAAGYAGTMDYLADRQEAYADPNRVLDGVRSVVMLGLAYRTVEPAAPQPGQGRVSRYAWGDKDYHIVIRKRLHKLADWFREIVPQAETRGVVDTAPLLERDFARLAGLGWIGKNGLLINPSSEEGRGGSYFFLAAMLTNAELAVDQPTETDHCANCTACLDACPTDAFVGPRVLDASRCVSYLTIELRDHMPVELRAGIGDRVFGCDTCQDVCPYNRKTTKSRVDEFDPLAGMNALDLAELFDLDDAEFRRRFRHTPLWRAHREGLLRNAAIVLGNQRSPKALPALEKGLADPHPLVREASRWAIEKIQSEPRPSGGDSRESTETASLPDGPASVLPTPC